MVQAVEAVEAAVGMVDAAVKTGAGDGMCGGD